jgi:hypothetical protein
MVARHLQSQTRPREQPRQLIRNAKVDARSRSIPASSSLSGAPSVFNAWGHHYADSSGGKEGRTI